MEWAQERLLLATKASSAPAPRNLLTNQHPDKSSKSTDASQPSSIIIFSSNTKSGLRLPFSRWYSKPIFYLRGLHCHLKIYPLQTSSSRLMIRKPSVRRKVPLSRRSVLVRLLRVSRSSHCSSIFPQKSTRIANCKLARTWRIPDILNFKEWNRGSGRRSIRIKNYYGINEGHERDRTSAAWL